MDDAPPTVAEELVMALAVELHRKGLIVDADCLRMADSLRERAAELPHESERLEDAARLASLIPMEAAAPTGSDWRARQARARFRVVEGEE